MTKWRGSEEKEQLRLDIANGVVLDDVAPNIVYDMHEGIYHKFDYILFKQNLNNLRAAIRKSKFEVQEDKIAHTNTLNQRPLRDEIHPPLYPKWQNSVARALLVGDIKSGFSKEMKPAVLWRTRAEYLEFPLTVFRNHVYKETTKPLSKAYWDHQRFLAAQKRQKKK